MKDYVEAAIAQQVDGILLQSSEKEVGEAMNEAMNQKIPLVTMLHDNYNGKRCSFLGINEVDIGKQYVSLIQKAISKKKRNVCIFTENTKGMGDYHLVIQTIRQQVKDADVTIVSVDTNTEFGMEKAVRGLLLDKNKCPDVLVCLSMDATTYAYQTVVDQSKVGSVKIIGAYENDEIIMAIQKKILEASVTVSPKTLGEKAVDTLEIMGSSEDYNVKLLEKGLSAGLRKSDTVVKKAYAKGWIAEHAYQTVSDFYEKGGECDAIICGNDDLAAQAILALSENRKAGKVYVLGQDGDLSACQRIVEGTQGGTVFKNVDELAKEAATMCVKLAKGEEISGITKRFDGTNQVDSYFLTPVFVDKKNLNQIIIDGGFHTKEEVYINE